MKRLILAALVAAVFVHGAILLFGGLVMFHGPARSIVREDVELLASSEETPDKEKEKDKPKEQEQAEEAADEQAQIEAAREQMPDLRSLAALEGPAAAPALAALSLSDLEGALGGAGGGGAFAEGFSLSSGGRIGGTGTASGGDGLGDFLSIADLDQRPRPVFQASPSYPQDLRRRKVEGTVHLVFYVDRDGRVQNPKVERSTNPAFERPALEAVRQWKFEAGTKNGQRVAFKMRIPITFQAG